MVTEEEIKNKQFKDTGYCDKPLYQVTAVEMAKFRREPELSYMIADRWILLQNEYNISVTKAYEKIYDLCRISETSLKKVINGSQKVSRHFLYKFTVGLKMDLEEADKYFALCGGKLSSDNMEDYICISALRDKDDIDLFAEQFEHFTEKK